MDNKIKGGLIAPFEVCEFKDVCHQSNQCNGCNLSRECTFSCAGRRGRLIAEGYNVRYGKTNEEVESKLISLRELRGSFEKHVNRISIEQFEKELVEAGIDNCQDLCNFINNPEEAEKRTRELVKKYDEGLKKLKDEGMLL